MFLSVLIPKNKVKKKYIYIYVLPPFFTKGNTFVFFCLLDDVPLPKQASTLKGENLLLEEQILNFKSKPLEKASKYANDRVTSPESVSLHLIRLLRDTDAQAGLSDTDCQMI